VGGQPPLAVTAGHAQVIDKNHLHDRPSSAADVVQVLAGAGVTARVVRQPRLADLAHRLDPRVVAAAFAITEGAALWYVTGTVDGQTHRFN
jgi:hypothetical protein